ncbi:uncharacterized protein At1g76660-like isoform X1 [Olea europaea var. sylvestris]|uniref:uncharacterized protein At1g76660-like isoform X1 n=1 Tax=Olea europaea var. sylvestris TaxID=158386 RepID=UPI000C1D41D2|nr:uncharacterized protein At1g76660-like isoform X1 [Olea europaea var. sylvestris]XP_022850346.1 uncharacterized protein At1g76660-like isoform X1 [Olea europaea var. sylvestris]
MGSEQNQFPQLPAPRVKRWGCCWGGMSCFGKQKGGKRIVPASRSPEANSLSNQPDGHLAGGLPNQSTSILAPPSSPVSFSNSALPSTTQSPNCYLSANSPGGPSSTMFVTGPYAHETQLVSPPVFSTFTTEPSTAPLTPPPELAHITTPSSPDVPYARFLSSSANLKATDKDRQINANDLQMNYSLYPESPASSLRSPVSRTSGDGLSSSFREREIPLLWDTSILSQETACTKSESGRLLGLQPVGVSTLRQDSNFFCPETFAQFYLDHSTFSHSGGRLSISRESDAYSSYGNGHQNRQNKTCKPDVEEIEAYRASFGFSADEIITTTQYVEISDITDDSFSMTPCTSNQPHEGEHIITAPTVENPLAKKTHEDFPSPQFGKAKQNHDEGAHFGMPGSCNGFEVHVPHSRFGDGSARNDPDNYSVSDNDDLFHNVEASRISQKHHLCSSNSDTEIEYRRGRSMRGGRSLRQC